MIRYTTNTDTRILLHFSVNGIVKQHDIVGAICSTVSSISPEYSIVALQHAKKVAQLKLDLYEHKVEKTNKMMTIGTLTIETNLDPADNAILISLIEATNKVHLHGAKFVYKSHEDTKEFNINSILARSKQLYPLFTGTQKQDLRKNLKDLVRGPDTSSTGNIQTIKGYYVGSEFNGQNEVIVVEGRNDVVKLVECNYLNVMSINGFNFVESEIQSLLKDKIITLFMDADSGGHQNVLKISHIVDIKYIVNLPAGKKVEELSKKEVIEAINNKIPFIRDAHNTSSS